MKTRIICIAFTLIGLLACKENSHRAPAKNATSVAEDTTLRWIDYHIGEQPPVGYYDAFDSTIRKWHIRYQRIEGGCEATPEQRARYEKDNPKYFRTLEKKFGKNWLDRFYADVKTLTDQPHLNKPANQ